MVLNSSEEDLIVMIQAIFSLVSVFGALFMMFALLAFKHIKKPKTSFYLGLAVTKFVPYVVMFSTCLYLLYREDDNPNVCLFQAAVMQLFLPTSWLYTLCISFHMWMRIKGVPQDRFVSMAKLLHAFCWALPVVILFVVVAVEIDDIYEPSWCWLSNDSEARHVQILLYFFIPMAIVYFLNLFIVVYAYFKARKDFFTDNELAGLITRTMRQKLKRQMESLVTYPIIFLMCYTLALVDRFYNFKNPGHPKFTLSVLHTIMLLDGFTTSVIFCSTSSVNRRMAKRWRMLTRCR